MTFWNTLSHWGTAGALTDQRRSIILCNRVSFLTFLFALAISASSLAYFGFIHSTLLGFGFAFLFLLPLGLNQRGYTNGSRIHLSVTLSIASIVISILDKRDYVILEEMQYFEFRLTLLTATLFPFLLFDLAERKLWLFTLSVNLLCIIAYDPLHEWMGVGYYQLGFTGPNYYFINYVVGATFLVISVSTYFLKFSFEKAQYENADLIRQLSAKQQELLIANEVIENQRKNLSIENQQLNNDLVDTNEKLTNINHELVAQNNNLQQFSYTVSHNLRGPVASLRGLLNLVNKQVLGAENAELCGHFETSVLALDTIIKDLNHIIELRTGVGSVRETVELRRELDQIKSLLQREIAEQGVVITVELSEPKVETIKAMLYSILYNLISNAIKYRSYERPLIINIRSQRMGSFVQIDVQDNGLGINLNEHKEKLFGLYKRFHTHTEGKGLGLFLVKLQAESLGGNVKVSSKPGVGSTFTVVVEG
jgi:signal transduction histidine kinase